MCTSSFVELGVHDVLSRMMLHVSRQYHDCIEMKFDLATLFLRVLMS